MFLTTIASELNSVLKAVPQQSKTISVGPLIFEKNVVTLPSVVFTCKYDFAV